jgi:hypothetical protein
VLVIEGEGFAGGLVLLIAIAFPLAFTGLWFAIRSLLSRLSGWSTLQAIYPDQPELSLTTLRLQSAVFRCSAGVPVSVGSFLHFEACPTGLKVGMLKLLGAFQRPFFVPWTDMAAEADRVWSGRIVRLRLARWPGGEIRIRQRTYDRLAASTSPKLRDRAVNF